MQALENAELEVSSLLTAQPAAHLQVAQVAMNPLG
jgi:hypothetical protein